MPKPRTAREATVTCSGPNCAETFTVRGERLVTRAASGRPMFHAPDCKAAANWVDTPCIGCGEVVRRRRSAVEQNADPARAICGPCRDRGVGAKPKRGTTEPCATCGVPVYRRQSAQRDVRYCSDECRGKALEGERVERIERPCAVCGTVMRLTPDQRRQDVQTCSRECTAVNRRSKDRYIDPSGYAWITTPDGRRMLEHRYVMEQHLGRPLLPSETVHHKVEGFAGRSVNDLARLELWTGNHPKGHRVEDVVEYAREMLALYGTPEERARYAAGGAVS